MKVGNPRVTLPAPGNLLAFFADVNRALCLEDVSYRPRDGDGEPGGLVLLSPGIPTIVIPDIHARPLFVRSVLDYALAPGGLTVEESVRRGQAQLVCVGDYFHGEGRVADRWRIAFEEFADDFIASPAMDAEMAESLAVLDQLGALKYACPRFVHLLKGNHENVTNESGDGNYQFGKYAYEGAMVALWMRLRYGDAGISSVYQFEKRLPLVAVGERFVISHAEPRRYFARGRIVGYRRDPEVVYGFTWTDNDAAEKGSVDAMLDELLPAERRAGARWLGGHRPVADLYNVRASGSFVQFHNPNRSLIAVLPPGRAPIPESDIVDIGEGQDTRDEPNSR